MIIFFLWEGDRGENLMLHSVKKQLLLHWYEAIRIIYHRSKSNYLGLLSQYCNCGIYRVSTTADIGNDWLTPQTSVMLHHFSRLLLFSETIDETTSHPFERSNTNSIRFENIERFGVIFGNMVGNFFFNKLHIFLLKWNMLLVNSSEII